MKTLITGGAGYIGSTIASACFDRDIDPIVIDDLSRGRKEFTTKHPFYHGDIADGNLIDRIFREHPDIESVVHCAASIVVPESVAYPLKYYNNNVNKTLALIEHIMSNNCSRIVYSSSASIYDSGPALTVDEQSPLNPQSPYATTKMVVELILQDITSATGLHAISMRYFNPVGADPKMRTGQQDPTPTHAMGKLIQASEDGRPFTLTGVDWPTRDGSAVRDYIHVWDLSGAHVEALLHFDGVFAPGEQYVVLNVGTGTGTTVRELIATFEGVVGNPLEIREAERRPGDVAGCYSRSDKAQRLLGWEAQLTIQDAVRHSLEWRDKRPQILGKT